ncbi:TPA: hypothetical protein ACV8GT_005529, partial [Escherichia coli]
QADGIQNGISKFGRVFRLHSGSISREFSGRVLRDFRKCFQEKMQRRFTQILKPVKYRLENHDTRLKGVR